MSYATLQDLIDRFGTEELVQLTDRASIPPAQVDETVITKALTDADAEIDGYLAARYSLPLASIPHRLVKVAADMARFYLHGKAADETIRNAYDDAVKWLVNVSKGVVQLGLLEAGGQPASEGGPQSSAGSPLFGDIGRQGF